ncbi:MAG: nitronate monooxygenase [[Eubacterium] rectale]|nr:nitronate monooxygenase [Agathobacter rectalis]
METRITKLLGIKYPVIQGGMAWVATHELASAVSNAGGLGIIGAGGAPASWVKEQIVAAKKETDKSFGVNLMLMNPEADEIAKIIAEEKVKVVTTGAGNPAKYMDMWKEAGVIVIPVVASVALAKLMERGGASAVIAEGMESGGHIGAQTLRNKMTRQYLKLEKEGAPFEELEKMTLGALRKAVVDGDTVYGSVMAGQSAGLVKKEETCKEIIEDVVGLNK